MLTVNELMAFEADIAAEFNAGKIAAPVHLAGGNEEQLIEIFRAIRPQDWILTTWRSHYHCLLRGVPPAQVKDAILRGRSIALCFPEYRILSSAIVGGICPIATGLAWAIKERKGSEIVHCFVGDMAAESGIFRECVRYCRGHQLPVQCWIEDNRKSVCTDTRKAWGDDCAEYDLFESESYYYQLAHAHVGTGQWVRF